MSNNVLNELNSYKNSINNYKSSIEDLKRNNGERFSIKQMIINREQELINEIQSKGIDPNNLSSAINNKLTSLREVMNKLTSLIPQDGSIPNNIPEILKSLQVNDISIEPTDTNLDIDCIDLDGDY